MDFAEITLRLFQVGAPILMAQLAWLAARLATYIRSKVGNEYLRGVLVRLDEAVLSAVKELQQTIVDEIKAASADGKITAEERTRIKNAAIDNVKSYLGPKGLAELAKILGLTGTHLDGYLSSRVEAAVHDLRRTRAGYLALKPGSSTPQSTHAPNKAMLPVLMMPDLPPANR